MGKSKKKISLLKITIALVVVLVIIFIVGKQCGVVGKKEEIKVTIHQ